MDRPAHDPRDVLAVATPSLRPGTRVHVRKERSRHIVWRADPDTIVSDAGPVSATHGAAIFLCDAWAPLVGPAAPVIDTRGSRSLCGRCAAAIHRVQYHPGDRVQVDDGERSHAVQSTHPGVVRTACGWNALLTEVQPAGADTRACGQCAAHLSSHGRAR